MKRYNLLFNPAEADDRTSTPVGIDVKASDKDGAWSAVMDELHTVRMPHYINWRDMEDVEGLCDEGTPDDGFDLRVIFECDSIREVASEGKWSAVFPIDVDAVMGMRFGLLDCGLNADWCVSSWHLSGGEANLTSGDTYLIDNEDGTYQAFRRWYVHHNYAGPCDSAPEDERDGHNDAIVSVSPLMDGEEAIKWVADTMDANDENLVVATLWDAASETPVGSFTDADIALIIGAMSGERNECEEAGRTDEYKDLERLIGTFCSVLGGG